MTDPRDKLTIRDVGFNFTLYGGDDGAPDPDYPDEPNGDYPDPPISGYGDWRDPGEKLADECGGILSPVGPPERHSFARRIAGTAYWAIYWLCTRLESLGCHERTIRRATRVNDALDAVVARITGYRRSDCGWE